jgi:hypothetical protein
LGLFLWFLQVALTPLVISDTQLTRREELRKYCRRKVMGGMKKHGQDLISWESWGQVVLYWAQTLVSVVVISFCEEIAL